MSFLDNTRIGGFTTVPQAVRGSFADRETYIAQGEAMAPIFALWNEPWLHDAVLLWFIDNLGVVSCLCKGASSVYDFGCVIHGLHMMVAVKSLAVWWEHVDSKANISDGGTRNSFAEYQALGVSMRPAPMPPWPESVFKLPASFWLSWLGL